MHRWRALVVLTALSACVRAGTPAAPLPDPHAQPSIAELELQRDAAALIDRSQRGPDVALAIRGLGRVADEPALSQLFTLLTPEATRPAAARALASARLLGADVEGGEAALLTLWPRTAPQDRIALAESLGRLGSIHAVAPLTEALQAGPDELREPAAIALGVLARRSSIPFDAPARTALIAATTSTTTALRYASAYALAHEFEPDPKTSQSTTDALTRLAADPDPETRAVALTGLTRRKSDARPLFEAGLGDRDFRVRVAAVRGLLALADDAAATRLLAWVHTSLADPTAIHPALEALAGVDHLLDRPGSNQTPAWLELATPILRDAESALIHNPNNEPLAHIVCHTRVLLARRPEWRQPIICPTSLPLHISKVLTAERLGRGLGSPGESSRLDPLEQLRRDLDPRVRAAAISAAAALVRRREPVPEDWLLAALADPSPAVVGALADALAAPEFPPLTPAVRDALAARTREELTREVELYASLTAALAATRGPAEPCTAGLTHASPAVRTAARTCITTLTGTDPGPQQTTQPPRRPPQTPNPGPRIRWRLTTTRGVIDVDLDPGAAPWHVAALVDNTLAGFYNHLTFHRVVPGFVVQGGDPEGTGWGGPGYTLPSEPTDARFTRGAVGIADAGKDTGGSQFFFMHARAPHLEARFTWVGEVVSGQDVVDALLIGDEIQLAEIPNP